MILDYFADWEQVYNLLDVDVHLHVEVLLCRMIIRYYP